MEEEEEEKKNKQKKNKDEEEEKKKQEEEVEKKKQEERRIMRRGGGGEEEEEEEKKKKKKKKKKKRIRDESTQSSHHWYYILFCDFRPHKQVHCTSPASRRSASWLLQSSTTDGATPHNALCIFWSPFMILSTIRPVAVTELQPTHNSSWNKQYFQNWCNGKGQTFSGRQINPP